jgi:hypothetical protein
MVNSSSHDLVIRRIRARFIALPAGNPPRLKRVKQISAGPLHRWGGRDRVRWVGDNLDDTRIANSWRRNSGRILTAEKLRRDRRGAQKPGLAEEFAAVHGGGFYQIKSA